MYCLPSLPMYVDGIECAGASSFSRQSSLPLRASIARKMPSIVAPMKTRLPAVVMPPPRLGAPVSLMPFAMSSGILAERNAPRDVAGVRVHRNQLAPRRLRAAVLVLPRPRTVRPPASPCSCSAPRRAGRDDVLRKIRRLAAGARRARGTSSAAPPWRRRPRRRGHRVRRGPPGARSSRCPH